MEKYNPGRIESKWQQKWEKERFFSPDLDRAKNPFYNLMMFPYPSAEGFHVGNMYAFTGSDIYGRYKRMLGLDVFEPIGLDGFGIHSENYAIKIGRHPAIQAKISEKNFYRQLRATGNAFDWTRTLETYDPGYYRWTQWIFIQLFKAGLAYRKRAPVNFCPSCKTVLADEQVINDRCERCSSLVEKRELDQWFFKITDYADRLLAGLERIDWTEKVKIVQRNWIGKSEGARIKFQIPNSKFQMEVFTTRPDTLFGATFMVLSPEHPIVASLLNSKIMEIKRYVDQAKAKAEQERIAQGREKTGVFTGLWAINPLTNEEIPIWIADYVLLAYGTGAIMGVPAHDQRDYQFAQKFRLPIRVVVLPEANSEFKIVSQKGRPKLQFKIDNKWTEGAYDGGGIMVNSGAWNGWKVPKDIGKVIRWLAKKGPGKLEVTYHLRDWLISRQRYWGPPIPVIYCRKCWEVKSQSAKVKSVEGKDFAKIDGKEHVIVPVPEDQLPVLLPDVADWRPKGIHSTGSGQAVKSPLASVESFVKTKCPSCGTPAVRETDVSDTFLDSAWYFFRYLATDWDNVPFPMAAAGPVAPIARGPASSSFHSTLRGAQGGKRPESNGTPSATATPRKLLSNVNGQMSNMARRARWLPVNMYIGGAEHAVLHLLYTRFLTMVFHDLGLLPFNESFSKFRAHGLLISGGAKMSKSRGNVVIPDAYIEKFGADTLRCYLMFCGDFSQGGDFRDTGIEGMHRFLKRVWKLVDSWQTGNKKPDNLTTRQPESLYLMHKTIKKVTEDIESLHYNTAIAALMEWLNALEKRTDAGPVSPGSLVPLTREEIATLLLLLAPFAPYMSEELWQVLRSQKSKVPPEARFAARRARLAKGGKSQKFESIHFQPWPKFDPKLAQATTITLVVQVNGKVRDKLLVEAKISREEAEKLALASPKVQKYLNNKKPQKIIFVPGRLINLVVVV